MGSHRKSKTPNSSSQKRQFFTVNAKDENNNNSNNSLGINGNGNHHHHTPAAAAADVKELNNRYVSRYEYEDDDNTARSLDFSKVLQDVEGSLVGTMTSSVVAITGLLSNSPSSTSTSGGSFRVTWKELVYLILAIVVLAGLSIFMGVAAGITISIHYFDTHSTPSFPRLEARERDLGRHQRVTTLDYSIVSSNVLHPFLGTTTTSSPHDEKTMDLTLGRVITMSESGQRSVLFVVEETPPLMMQAGVGNNETHNASNTNLPVPICRNETTPGGSSGNDFDGSNDLLLLDGQYKPYKHKGPPDSRFQLTSSKVHPTLCSDGVTIGYDNWATLKEAVEEANALSAERFMKWNEYFATLEGTTSSSDWFDQLLRKGGSVSQQQQEESTTTTTTCPDEEENHDELLLQYYYDEDIVFTICPGSTLRARKGPIFINAENIQIECGDPEEYYYIRAAQQSTSPIPSGRSAAFSQDSPACTLDVGGTHLSFGPHAKNVLIRGLVFQSAKTSSLAFHYDGAQASFEDCIWMDNAGVHGKYGAVADVNSTSNVNFYRCEIGSSLARVANIASGGIAGGPVGSPMMGHGSDTLPNVIPGGPNGSGMTPGFASFLSLRN